MIKCQFNLRILMQDYHKFPPLPNHKFNNIKIISLSKAHNHSFQRNTKDINEFLINETKSIKERQHSSDDRKKNTHYSTSPSQDGHSRSGSTRRSQVKAQPRLYQNGSAYIKMPKVTAKSWLIHEMKENKCIYGVRNFKKRQIASLTKMLNLITILNLVSSLKLDPKKIKAYASQRASSVIGTTAELKEERLYVLEDLYYGMMLPSGNDAATMIAQIGGCLLKANEELVFNFKKFEDPQFTTNYIQKESSTVIGTYLREMNRFAKEIGMLNTNLANPHGLSNTCSLSTATDLAKLCSHAMKNNHFRKIVSTRKYTYTYPIQDKTLEQDKENVDPNKLRPLSPKQIGKGNWENTNRMLGEGWSGIKTGITPNAGPCLAASCQKIINGRSYQFLVILLSSQSMEARWREVRSLVEWAIEHKLYD